MTTRVPAPQPHPRPRRTRTRRGHRRAVRLLRAGTAPPVLYVGKLSDEKGVPPLLEAMQTVDARLIVIGFGQHERRSRSGQTIGCCSPARSSTDISCTCGPSADVAVIPSALPEAFGMVAAEAAACGCPPLVARHPGLAEIATRLEASYPAELRHLASFETGDVGDLRRKLTGLVPLSMSDRRRWPRRPRDRGRDVEPGGCGRPDRRDDGRPLVARI